MNLIFLVMTNEPTSGESHSFWQAFRPTALKPGHFQWVSPPGPSLCLLALLLQTESAQSRILQNLKSWKLQTGATLAAVEREGI